MKAPICDCVNCQGKKPMDVGPFVFDGSNTIQSDDFSHDVTITFSGDMLSGDYEQYGEWLTAVLNAATQSEISEQHATTACVNCGSFPASHPTAKCQLWVGTEAK